MGPAGCRSLGPQVGPAACGSCRRLSTVVVLLMMRALSGRAWLQSRRLVGVHCSHFPSLLVNGAHTSRRGEGRLLGAGLPLSRLVRARRLLASHRQVGPTACRPYRQSVVGAWPSPLWVMSWAAWQQCGAGLGMATRYAALWPRSFLDSGVAGCTVATPRLVIVMRC